MIFDVMIKEVEKNAAGKDVFNVFRVHDAVLSKYLREVQDNGKYIVSVIPLFRPKLKEVITRYIPDWEKDLEKQKNESLDSIGE